jgi:hypothetical protein
MEKEAMGATGPVTRGFGGTGPLGPSCNSFDDRIDEMIRLLRSIDENVKQINAKLK